MRCVYSNGEHSKRLAFQQSSNQIEVTQAAAGKAASSHCGVKWSHSERQTMPAVIKARPQTRLWDKSNMAAALSRALARLASGLGPISLDESIENPAYRIARRWSFRRLIFCRFDCRVSSSLRPSLPCREGRDVGETGQRGGR